MLRTKILNIHPSIKGGNLSLKIGLIVISVVFSLYNPDIRFNQKSNLKRKLRL